MSLLTYGAITSLQKKINGIGMENVKDGILIISKHRTTLDKALRKALDDEGFNHVKIVVSSGFDKAKVELFTKENAPVDTYGIGGSLIKCTRSFTGDVVNKKAEPEIIFGTSEQ